MASNEKNIVLHDTVNQHFLVFDQAVDSRQWKENELKKAEELILGASVIHANERLSMVIKT